MVSVPDLLRNDQLQIVEPLVRIKPAFLSFFAGPAQDHRQTVFGEDNLRPEKGEFHATSLRT